MNTQHLVLVLALATSAALACSKTENKDTPQPTSNKEPEPTSATTPSNAKVDTAKAQVIFNERCSACHGPEGKGNGPASAALNPKPRNYTDKAWQTATSDEQIRKTILLGGAAVGTSPIMPASPDLDDKPEVVEGLVKLVRKFGG
jgi:mono/diheme cytochrome c family protein